MSELSLLKNKRFGVFFVYLLIFFCSGGVCVRTEARRGRQQPPQQVGRVQNVLLHGSLCLTRRRRLSMAPPPPPRPVRLGRGFALLRGCGGVGRGPSRVQVPGMGGREKVRGRRAVKSHNTHKSKNSNNKNDDNCHHTFQSTASRSMSRFNLTFSPC